jgi:hypothetical protein
MGKFLDGEFKTVVWKKPNEFQENTDKKFNTLTKKIKRYEIILKI